LAAPGLARNSKRREICAAEVSTYDRLRRNDSHDLKIAQNIEENRPNTTDLSYRQSKPIVGLRVVAQKLPGTLGRDLPKCDRSRPRRALQFLSKRGTRKKSDLACRPRCRRPASDVSPYAVRQRSSAIPSQTIRGSRFVRVSAPPIDRSSNPRNPHPRLQQPREPASSPYEDKRYPLIGVELCNHREISSVGRDGQCVGPAAHVVQTTSVHPSRR